MNEKKPSSGPGSGRTQNVTQRTPSNQTRRRQAQVATINNDDELVEKVKKKKRIEATVSGLNQDIDAIRNKIRNNLLAVLLVLASSITIGHFLQTGKDRAVDAWRSNERKNNNHLVDREQSLQGVGRSFYILLLRYFPDCTIEHREYVIDLIQSSSAKSSLRYQRLAKEKIEADEFQYIAELEVDMQNIVDDYRSLQAILKRYKLDTKKFQLTGTDFTELSVIMNRQ